jgi:hypothetical protein
LDQDVTLLVGANVEVRKYGFDPNGPGPGTFAGATDDDDYYKINLQVGGTWFVEEDLAITALFSPGVYSDLDGSLNHSDWYFEGSGLATWKSSDELYWKVGIAADETFDDVPVFPLFGFSYLIDEEWRVDVLLPWAAVLSYLANSQTTVALGLELEGAAYNIRSSAGTGKVETENRIQEFRAYLGVEYQFAEQFSTSARFGAILAGDYDIRTGSGPGAGISDGDIEPALFFQVGLGLSF